MNRSRARCTLLAAVASLSLFASAGCRGSASAPTAPPVARFARDAGPTKIAQVDGDGGASSAPDPAASCSDAGATAPMAAAPPVPREVGPYEIPFIDKRTVYFAVPATPKKGQRLIANLHGMCNPPGYACGYWVNAGSARGFLVCPRGNSECGPGVSTWTEGWQQIDSDLEASIAAVDQTYPGEMSRDGAVLTGFSLGASVAPLIAEAHPGRWPYLVIVEATPGLSAEALKKAGVRGVALISGELGANVYGQRAVASSLNAQGMPARTWVMPKAGHWYSANIDEIMAEAIDWLIGQGDGADGAETSDAPVARAH